MGLMLSLATRIFIKIVVSINWVATRIRTLKNQSKTQIFLDNETESQIQSYSQLKKISCESARKSLAILIPFRDRFDLTSLCLNSILKQNLTNLDVEVVLIDNGSAEPRTISGIQEYEKKLQNVSIKTTYLRCDYPFNFSRLNNDGVKQCASCDLILLLNNDIEFSNNSIILQVSEFLTFNEMAGAVGTTLIYPNSKIQHLFLAPGIKIVGAHPGKGWLLDTKEQWFQSPRPVAAITGAFLMMRYRDFEKVGGLDERLGQNYQDLDLCLKLQGLNKTNWVLPNLVSTHHESASRKKSPPVSEAKYMYEKWGETLHFNAYFHEKFSRWSELPLYRSLDSNYPYRAVLLGKY